MSNIQKNLERFKITIPEPPNPVGNYSAYTISQKKIYISGQLPIKENGEIIKGKIGENLTIAEGKEATKIAILNTIGHLKRATGDLNKVKKCLKINGFINCTSSFHDHPALLNIASNIIINIFGEKGKHARAVIGVSSLPFNSAVEIETIFEIDV